LDGFRARVDALRATETALIRVGVSPHAPYSVSDALYTAVASYAREERLPLATHVAESAAESALVREAAGPFADFLRGRGIATEPRAPSPVALLDRTGVLGRDALLIPCVHADAPDVARIAASGAAVATCPRSNRYFGHGTAPVAAFRAAGVRVGIGTDSMASNVTMDLLAETRAAGCGGLSDCWAAASLGGARALGLDGAVGTLEAGKAADLAAFAAPGARGSATLPEAVEPAASLLVVAGVERVRNGRVAADVSGISARAQAAADRLREWRARQNVRKSPASIPTSRGAGMAEHSGRTAKIWRDGAMVDWADANIHVMCHVVHYGSAVFEGMRSYETPRGGAVFRLREHMRRLHESAKIYELPLRWSVDEL